MSPTRPVHAHKSSGAIIGKRHVYPVLLPFPIWRYGPRYDFDGHYIDDGWWPDRYAIREVPTDA